MSSTIVTAGDPTRLSRDVPVARACRFPVPKPPVSAMSATPAPDARSSRRRADPYVRVRPRVYGSPAATACRVPLPFLVPCSLAVPGALAASCLPHPAGWWPAVPPRPRRPIPPTPSRPLTTGRQLGSKRALPSRRSCRRPADRSLRLGSSSASEPSQSPILPTLQRTAHYGSVAAGALRTDFSDTADPAPSLKLAPLLD